MKSPPRRRYRLLNEAHDAWRKGDIAECLRLHGEVQRRAAHAHAPKKPVKVGDFVAAAQRLYDRSDFRQGENDRSRRLEAVRVAVIEMLEEIGTVPFPRTKMTITRGSINGVEWEVRDFVSYVVQLADRLKSQP